MARYPTPDWDDIPIDYGKDDGNELEEEAGSSGFLVVDQGGIDVAVPSDLDVFEKNLLELIDSVRAHLKLLVDSDAPELILRFLSLPSFNHRVAVLEIEGMSGDQSAVTVALRDRTYWEVIAPMEKWPVRGPRAVAAMAAFLEFHDSIPAVSNQILWLVEASWGAWSTQRDELPEYGDRYWILQEPTAGGDPVTNVVAERAREALDAMIEANDLKNAAKSYRSVKVGRHQTGIRTPQVNRNGVLMPKVAGLTAIERHQLRIVTDARFMLKSLGDDLDMHYYPSAVDSHDSPDPVLEVSVENESVMTLRLEHGSKWIPTKGFKSDAISRYVDRRQYQGHTPWNFQESSLGLLLQVSEAFQPDCDQVLLSKWHASRTRRQVVAKCHEVKFVRSEYRSLAASSLIYLLDLIERADAEDIEEQDRWLAENERVDPFDGCVGDGGCEPGCWYCDEYKEKHRAGKCGDHCFLCYDEKHWAPDGSQH